MASAVLAIVSYILLLKKTEIIVKINRIIIPLLIFIILIIGTKNIWNLDMLYVKNQLNVKTNFIWIIEALLYASYNLLLVIPVVASLGTLIKNKRQNLLISIYCGVIITIISLIVFFLMFNIKVDISKIEMPIVYTINLYFRNYNIVYGIIILISIFTTAISCGISITNNIKYKNIGFIICLISIIVSVIKFSDLVKIFFPLFGYIGIIQIYYIIKSK